MEGLDSGWSDYEPSPSTIAHAFRPHPVIPLKGKMDDSTLSRLQGFQGDGLPRSSDLSGQAEGHLLELLPPSLPIPADVKYHPGSVPDRSSQDPADEKFDRIKGLALLADEQARVLPGELETHTALVLLGSHLGLDAHKGEQFLKDRASAHKPLPSGSHGQPHPSLLPTKAQKPPGPGGQRLDEHILSGDAEFSEARLDGLIESSTRLFRRHHAR